MGDILAFPVANGEERIIEHRATCPHCGCDEWHITVDAVKVTELKTFVCAECDYTVILSILFSLKDDDRI